MSAIEKPLHIICDGFPGFSHFVDQKAWNFFHVATVMTTNSIDTPILRAPRRKEGKITRPDSRIQAVRSVREPDTTFPVSEVRALERELREIAAAFRELPSEPMKIAFQRFAEAHTVAGSRCKCI